jgi:hypothetical protein
MTFDVLLLLRLGIIVCAADGLTVRFANERAKAWFGTDLEGKPVASIVPSLLTSDVTEVVAKDRMFTLTGEVAPPHRRRIEFRLSISPKYLGKERLLVASIEDNTKPKEQEALLGSFPA